MASVTALQDIQDQIVLQCAVQDGMDRIVQWCAQSVRETKLAILRQAFVHVLPGVLAQLAVRSVPLELTATVV